MLRLPVREVCERWIFHDHIHPGAFGLSFGCIAVNNIPTIYICRVFSPFTAHPVVKSSLPAVPSARSQARLRLCPCHHAVWPQLSQPPLLTFSRFSSLFLAGFTAHPKPEADYWRVYQPFCPIQSRWDFSSFRLLHLCPRLVRCIRVRS